MIPVRVPWAPGYNNNNNKFIIIIISVLNWELYQSFWIFYFSLDSFLVELLGMEMWRRKDLVIPI